MRFLTKQLLAAGLVLVFVPAAQAARPVRPPVVWEPGAEHYTEAHRKPGDIRYIVIHTAEGTANGTVSWFQNDRSHASAHYVVSRAGEIVQLVRQRNIAWHAGNWVVNASSIGIEHEGVTGDPAGYTDAEYRASARLVAYIARTMDVPIDRQHIIGHDEVLDPNNPLLRGGSDHHTDPGPYWDWPRYMRLVRAYAGAAPLLPQVRIAEVSLGRRHVLHGILPWRARTTAGVRRVDFRVDGRLVLRDTRPPFVLRRLNTTALLNGRHVLEVHAYGRPGLDVWRRQLRVWNRPFVVGESGLAGHAIVSGTVGLTAHPRGAAPGGVVLFVDGIAVATRSRRPFTFSWDSSRWGNGPHTLELRARARDGRVGHVVVPVVVMNAPPPQAQIVGQSLADGQTVTGTVTWSVQIQGPVRRVDFLVDNAVRHTSTYLPFAFAWSTARETPGAHTLTVRAARPDGTAAVATVVVTVTS